jgi:cobalt transporter subunit CbtB
MGRGAVSQETGRRGTELRTAAGGVAKEACLTTQSATTSVVRGYERTDTLVAIVVAFLFGIGLVYTTGFSHPSTIHNAAHDTRHALSFPCH